MHDRSLLAWQHGHVFLGAAHGRHERRTWMVVALTAVAMVAEIVAGAIYGSMALTADGWHMSTHAAALAISALAYRFARRTPTTRGSRSGPASSASLPPSRAPSSWP